MAAKRTATSTTNDPAAEKRVRTAENWKRRYAEKHRLERVSELPPRIQKPKKVRIYARQEHFQLQWWEPSCRRTNTLRINGDLLDALAKAREIDQRLVTYKRSGHAGRRIQQAELVEKYLQDTTSRADAGKIAVATVDRFRAALGHYLAFIETPAAKDYSQAHTVDRAFSLQFAAWLAQRRVARNGRADGTSKPMTATGIVLDVVRAMFEWAADPQRGHLLPAGFTNPFRRAADRSRNPPRDPLGEPDITIDMAAALLTACDDFQLRLFAPIVLWGLRPSEVAWMFHEHADSRFLKLNCIEAMGYLTKGVRDKSLPIPDVLRPLLQPSGSPNGLIFLRRAVTEGRETPPQLGKSVKDLITAYDDQIQRTKAKTARDREQIRDAVLHDAGGITYKMIQGEFTKLATALKWPATATLKDLRHLCQTALDNGGMTREERQYLLGQSLGHAAITAYIHINKLPVHYQRAIDSEMKPILDVLASRTVAA